ncbi:MAG: DUF4062 domain-containing protein [Balneola sp.]|nr:DUF4062 domain-containing protein [Balneola sp.]MBO6650116.1 DUF4062 domain-containing protein [Balneola sp.]MBO6710479.1 DUF4062 domain-containing protein [Balneola sp.]MBO6799164.1 DUF4062 domain-containing protein [Balneola sp.]MBO6871004.1 DUF4062 domain-containing protein [Balneola sp.]
MTRRTKLSNINFFICSTYLDLKDYRTAVIEKLKNEAGIINAQEFFGARDQKPIETCLEEVKKSDIFLMFVGWRYGSIEKDKNKSFVELEYEKACDLKIPKFIFFMDENTPISPKFISKGTESELLVNFKNKIANNNTIDFFSTKEDLSNKVVQSLLNELPKHGFEIGEKDQAAHTEDLLFSIKRFQALPKLYYDTEITFHAKLKNFERADRHECEAFSYSYGSTVKRKFNIIDEKFISYFGSFQYLFAENHVADDLINLKYDSDFLIKAKTIQGNYFYEEPVREVKKVLRPDPSPVRLSFAGENLIEVNEEVQVGTKKRKNLLLGLEFISASKI